MSIFGSGERGNPGISKLLVIGVGLAIVAVGVLVVVLLNIPTAEHENREILQDAFMEGSPEFDQYSNKIIITNDPQRMAQSKTGLGGIVMSLTGRIRNTGDKTITGLEVSVAMVDTKNKVIKEKKVLFIPKYFPVLKPNESVNVTVNIDGFSENDDRANARWKVTAIRFK